MQIVLKILSRPSSGPTPSKDFLFHSQQLRPFCGCHIGNLNLEKVDQKLKGWTKTNIKIKKDYYKITIKLYKRTDFKEIPKILLKVG